MRKKLTQETINSFFEYLQSENKPARDISGYRRSITSLQSFAEQYDNCLSKSVLEEWKLSLEKQGLASGTITNHIVRINHFLRYIGHDDLCFTRGKRQDLTGKQFGNLLVLEPVDRKSKDRSIYWKCRCLSCGKEKEIPANQLTKGVHISCGCERKKRLQDTNGYIEDTCLKSVFSERLGKNNTSGHKGVFQKRGKWAAQIQYKKKTYYLGSFDLLKYAIEAREQAEIWVRNDAEKLIEKYKREKDKEGENTMQTTLLIMAAGIGSRFGGGIKQLEPVDENGHIIMDYSIHDAIEAGFNKVIFIIRKDIEKEFKEAIGDRIENICREHNVMVGYAFQDIEDIPGELPKGRTKPWGTGQAVLAAKEMLDTPFIVINADDYYGKEGFKAVHDYLVNGGKSCMAGFVLKNTLSDNGGVTRGICKMDKENNLTEVVETKNIVKSGDGAEADGQMIDVDSLVSMNMWGLTPDFLTILERGFEKFFEKEVKQEPLKAEYLIPIFIGELLKKDEMSVKVLKTNDTWYGMTYKEDVAAVKESFRKMLEAGMYKADLFSDLC